VTVRAGGGAGGSGGGVGGVGAVEVVFPLTSVGGDDSGSSTSVDGVDRGSSSTSGKSFNQMTRSVSGVLAGMILAVVVIIRPSSSESASLMPTVLGDGGWG